MNKHLLLFLAGIAAGTLSCANLNGSGSTTTNGHITGALYKTDGTPASGVRVLLLPADYDPVVNGAVTGASVDTTDALGRYYLQTSRIGVFAIEAVHLTENLRALITDVRLTRPDTIIAPDDTILPTGAIEVVSADSADTANGYYYIPGTTLFARIRNGQTLIDSVPAGTIPAFFYGNSVDPLKNRLVRTGLFVRSGDTLLIEDYNSWKHSQNLFLNTTVSGADVSGMVMDFPVLVRLTSMNFNFSQAGSNGADIRFTKADSTPLPFEIERWDSAAGLAEIWVKVDTVYGNDSTHRIVMYWGASQASAVSNPEAVFDTASGFLGVWHLAEAGNTTAFDATANHFDGTPSGMSAASAVAGAVGVAQRFDGFSGGITLPNTAGGRLNRYGNGNYSFSAWVYADTLDTTFQPIVAKSNYQYALQIRNSKEWEFFIYKDSAWRYTRAPASAGVWKYITGVRQNDRQYLYIDGNLVNGTLNSLIEMPRVPDDTTRNVTIGFLPEMNRFFKGTIDEVRVMNRTTATDRVKLSFMNQRPGSDALVEFRQQIIRKEK